MAELRERHLGVPRTCGDRATATERLATACEAAIQEAWRSEQTSGR